MVDNYIVVGTCSLCGGDVVVPKFIWSVIKPIPTCRKCGATEAKKKLPVIDMKSSPTRKDLTWTSDRTTCCSSREIYDRIKELQKEMDGLNSMIYQRNALFSELMQKTIWNGIQADKIKDPFGDFW